MATDKALTARGFGKFLARRDALAIILTVLLWLVGLSLRPDYWWNLPNTFAILLNYTELALICGWSDLRHRAGDIDLSVGAVLALAGSAAAYSLKVLGLDPISAVLIGLAVGMFAGFDQRRAHRWLRAAVLHRHPRHVLHRPRRRLVARLRAAAHRLDRRLQPHRPQGRRHLQPISACPQPGGVHRRACRCGQHADAVDDCSSPCLAGIVLGFMPYGQRLYATGGNRRAADYAGINTNRVRFLALVFCALCAAMAGLINIAYFRSFNPSRRRSSASSTASPR